VAQGAGNGSIAPTPSADAANPPAAAAAAPPAAPSPAPATHTLSPDERDSIQKQIAALQADVAFMQRDQRTKLRVDSTGRTVVRADSNPTTHGGYDDKIAADKEQIAELQQQMGP
jgi:hypothetical protein